MIKISIDEKVLKLAPRSKRLGRRLFYGWLSLQTLTILLVLLGVGFFIWAGSLDSFSEKVEQTRQERLASEQTESQYKTE